MPHKELLFTGCESEHDIAQPLCAVNMFRLRLKRVDFAPCLALVGAAENIVPLAIDADERTARGCDDFAGGDASWKVEPRLSIGTGPCTILADQPELLPH